MRRTKIVNSQQMYAVDRMTIDQCGVPGSELMERAGRAVVEAIAARWDGLVGLSAVVACGKGNNGGDGFVVGRLLHAGGARVRAFLFAERERVRGDAAEHLRRLEDAGVTMEVLPDGGEAFAAALATCDVAVDALLGMGLRSAPQGGIARAIEALNRSGRPVVAVDIPSGVDADAGATPGSGVKAVLTVGLGLPKVGHLFYPGRACCGVLHLADIGFAERAVQAVSPVAHLLDADAMRAVLPRRSGDAHKGSCGSVAVVAGSVGMTGAAALTAAAALRAGSGRVSLGIPSSLNDVLEGMLTEVMTRPLPEVRRRRCLALRALGQIEALYSRADVLALGPGLGSHAETAELVRRIVRRCPLPLVLDADGINALSGCADGLRARSGDAILTPHIGEFARLTGMPREAVRADPIGVSRAFAQEYRTVIVLKGAPSLVALPDGQVLVNPTGNAGMATAGSGDVLTGLVAGFWAQGLSAPDAACLAVYVHGAAGDRARDRLGEWSMLAGDIAAQVPQSLVELASG